MINSIDFNTQFTIDEFVEYTIANKILNVNQNDILTRLAKCVKIKFETKNRLSSIFSNTNSSTSNKIVFNTGFSNGNNFTSNANTSHKTNNEYYNKIKLKYINTVTNTKTVHNKKRDLLTKTASNKSKKPNILNWFKKEDHSSSQRKSSVIAKTSSNNIGNDYRTRPSASNHESAIINNFYKHNPSRTIEDKPTTAKPGQTVLKSDVLNIDTYGTLFLSNDTSFCSSDSASDPNSDLEFLDFCGSKEPERVSNETELIIANSPKKTLGPVDSGGPRLIEEFEISPDTVKSSPNDNIQTTSQDVIVIEDSSASDYENEPPVPDSNSDVGPYDIKQSPKLTVEDAASETHPDIKIKEGIGSTKEEIIKSEQHDDKPTSQDVLKTERLIDDSVVGPATQTKVEQLNDTNEEINSLGVNVVILFGEPSNKNMGLVACWFATKVFGCTMEQLVQNPEKNPDEYLIVRNWRLQYINCAVFSEPILHTCGHRWFTNEPNSPSNGGPISQSTTAFTNVGLDTNTLSNLVSTVTNKNSKVCVMEGFDLLTTNTQILLSKYFSKVYDKLFVLTCGRLFRVENRIKSYCLLVRVAGFSASPRTASEIKSEYHGDIASDETPESHSDPAGPVQETDPRPDDEAHFSSDLTVGTFGDLFGNKPYPNGTDTVESAQRDSDVELIEEKASSPLFHKPQSNTSQEPTKSWPPPKPDLPAAFWEAQQSIIPHLNRVPASGASSPHSAPQNETDEKKLVDYLYNIASASNVKLSKLNLSSILHSVGFNLLMVYNILSKLIKNTDKPKFYLYKQVVTKNPQIAASASNGKLLGNLVYIILNFVPPNSGSDEKRARKYGLRDSRTQGETLLPNGLYSHSHFALMSSEQAPNSPSSIRRKLFEFICENPYLSKILGSIIGYYYPHNLNELLTDLYEAMTGMDKHGRLDPMRTEIVAFFAGFNFCSGLATDPNFMLRGDSQNDSRLVGRVVTDGSSGRTSSQRDSRAKSSQADSERPNPTPEELAIKHLEFLLKHVIFNLIALINSVG